MLHKVCGEREVCLFSENFSEVFVAWLDLFLGNEKVSSIITRENFKQFPPDKYYIVAADNGNYAEIRRLLVENGYKPVKDFVRFEPKTYEKIWQDPNV